MAKPKKHITFSVVLTASQHERLKQAAKEEHRTASHQMRLLLDRYLDEHERASLERAA